MSDGTAKRRVYLETPVVSYLASRPSRDVIVAARPQITHAWNVAHIANAVLGRRVEAVCRKHGHAAPVLCTPDELMEDPDVKGID